jgi:RimJ/RimL family protein N-acetyltransferase
MNTSRYDCIIHHKLLNTDDIKGPVVDLKLIGFFNTNVEDHVPYYLFQIISGNTVVGKIALRIGYSDLILIHGHVGYEIESKYQGHQYGYHALELIKKLARDHGYQAIIVTSSHDNERSKKTVMRAKGQLLIHDYHVPEDHIYHLMGIKKLNVYEISLIE